MRRVWSKQLVATPEPSVRLADVCVCVCVCVCACVRARTQLLSTLGNAPRYSQRGRHADELRTRSVFIFVIMYTFVSL